MDTLINVIFLGDIVVNMMSAYQDNDFNIVTNHKVTGFTFKFIFRLSFVDT
jgi:hypothetical protein